MGRQRTQSKKKGKKKRNAKRKKHQRRRKKLLKNRSLFGRSAAVRSMTSIWVVSLVMSAKKRESCPSNIYSKIYSIYTYNISTKKIICICIHWLHWFQLCIGHHKKIRATGLCPQAKPRQTQSQSRAKS